MNGMNPKTCLNCKYWVRDDKDLVIGQCWYCRGLGLSEVRSWRFQCEGDTCLMYRKARLSRKPYHDSKRLELVTEWCSPKPLAVSRYYSQPLPLFGGAG